MPIVGDKKILRATDGDEPGAETVEEVVDRLVREAVCLAMA